jgi:DNA-binding IclR family transcriptional regulator
VIPARKAESAPATVAGRLVAILDAFRTSLQDTLGISELARRTALPKPTVHRMVSDLVDTGLLERDGSAIRLGLKLFELGQRVPRQRDLRDAARPTMTDLREATRHTVHLAIREGHEVIYIEILHGPDAPFTPVRVGGRWPVHATGVGKAILAFSPPADVEALLAGQLPRLSERTVSAPGLLARELATIRQTRIAFDREESKQGLVCAASPIFDSAGVTAAVSLSGWSTRMDLDRVAAAVRTAALTISRELGGRGPATT